MLSRRLLPRHYKLDLHPDLHARTFSGKVRIEIDVKEETNVIEVHSQELEWQEVSCVINGQELPVSKDAVSFNEPMHTAVVTLPSTLAVGAVELRVSFTGTLNDRMKGFYSSKCIVDGKEHPVACTQFEATDARLCFPCFDEPNMKATFSTSLRVEKHLVALSNMPVESETEEGSDKVVTFMTTPVMSTYLLAFVVGQYDYVEGKTAEGVAMRVYTPRGKAHLGAFALDVGTKILSFFGNYFGLAYPLPKLDMIGLMDFAAGAMENWGLVTYRETAILIDEKTSPLSSKQRVASIVAHELAHQWFGNITTFDTWTDLWLNEGFATWAGALAVDNFFPEWDIWTDFAASYTQPAFALDSLENSHPIEVDVKNPDEISEIFDEISYNKGAAAILMIVGFLGADVFQEGLRLYLNRHKYSNACTNDLWRALSEASGKDCSAFMQGWTRSTGFPVVTVSLDGNTLHFTQNRLLTNGKGKEDHTSMWWVPIRLSFGGLTDVVHFDLRDRSGSLQLTAEQAGASFIKANAGQAAFFRCKYDAELGARLAANIASLPAIDRLGVQSDFFALAAAGEIRTHDALAVAAGYINETEYPVWSSLASSLSDIIIAWAGHERIAPALSKFVTRLFGPTLHRLGWTNQAAHRPLDPLLIALCVRSLGLHGDTEVGAKAREMVASGSEIAPDLQSAVFSVAVASGGAEEFETIYRIFKTAEMAETRNRALRALAYARQPALFNKLLNMVTENEIQSQDIYLALGTGGSHLLVAMREATWQYIQDHWEALVDRFGQGSWNFSSMIGDITSHFATQSKADEVKSFFESHQYAAATRTVQQSLEAIASTAAWLERDTEGLEAWLSSQPSS